MPDDDRSYNSESAGDFKNVARRLADLFGAPGCLNVSMFDRLGKKFGVGSV